MSERAFIKFHSYSMGQEEKQALLDTIDSGWITRGPKTNQFEKDFSNYVDAPFALGLNSCTAGLHLALKAYNIGPGDEVITTPLTFVATANVIIHVGATPVFVDIEADTLNMNPDLIESAITPDTKAIMPVHFAGHPCDMDKILTIARKHQIPVIEDAAHAIGAAYRQQMIGNIGDITVFSFYATKNITTGEGGMLTTPHQKVIDRLRPLALHGLSHNAWNRYSKAGFQHYTVEEPGYKYNMTDIQAALGLEQLKKCEQFRLAREQQVQQYQSELHDIPIEFLVNKDYSTHAHHLCVIKLQLEKLSISRDSVMQHLQEAGIGSAVHFIPVPQHPYYQKTLAIPEDTLPVTYYSSNRILSLPLYPDLSGEQISYISQTLRQYLLNHLC